MATLCVGDTKTFTVRVTKSGIYYNKYRKFWTKSDPMMTLHCVGVNTGRIAITTSSRYNRSGQY